MSEEVQPENQKTVVAFVAGLLIGGLLVWIFSGPDETKKEVEETEETEASVVLTETTETVATDTEEVENTTEVTNTLEVGDGSLTVADQPAGSSVAIEKTVFPTKEGWIAVRTYPNGQLGSVLGAARYSESQGLVPDTVSLLAPTAVGGTYAVVFFTEDGDRSFNMANDVQVDGILTTFTAQ